MGSQLLQVLVLFVSVTAGEVGSPSAASAGSAGVQEVLPSSVGVQQVLPSCTLSAGQQQVLRNAGPSASVPRDSHVQGTSGATSIREDTPLLGREHRVKVSSTKLRDYVTNTMVRENIDPPATALPTRSRSSGPPFYIACYVKYEIFSIKH